MEDPPLAVEQIEQRLRGTVGVEQSLGIECYFLTENRHFCVPIAAVVVTGGVIIR
jgi:hypothetical protein